MADDIENLRYQPFYCEENIWHLCQHPQYTGGNVVFIASYGDYFPMLCQQSGTNPNYLVLWDYHVVLLREGHILDFNSTLSFRSPLRHYFSRSFIDEELLDPSEAPRFRLLSAEEYVRTFQSDRSHMRTETGWQAPPPDWPVIGESGSNLQQYRDMHNFEFGDILSMSQMLSGAFG